MLEVRVEGAAAVREPKRIQIEGGEGSTNQIPDGGTSGS
ncbi:MAG: hypothetical protein M3358_19085 [Actinomycetota bacterium]|nr:hypothetical protein [Actinomycetota bacterium]